MQHPELQVLTIRFVGKQLKTHGLPISELGLAFVAIQRIINKAFLALEKRLDKRSFPDRREREILALQIACHEKRSDLFGLTPLILDPVNQELIKKCIEFVLAGLVSYAVGEVLESARGQSDDQKTIFIGSIHADVVNIVNRIENVGGCESIEIGSPAYAPQKKIEFTKKSKEYARHLANEPFLGQIQTIKGSVFKLYPNIEMVEIRRSGGKKCKVFLETKSFEEIRYGQVRSPVIEVTGRPRYRVGMEGKGFDEFEGHSIKIITEDGFEF